jgi:ABC-type branched-subunit amino acid transport system ATPase component
VQHIPPVLLELRNVDVVFDGIIQVLRSVNLEVRAGKVTALLGGNGAGKTTTLKAISGLLAVEHGKVTDGQILFEGEDISNADPVSLFRRGVVSALAIHGTPCFSISKVTKHVSRLAHWSLLRLALSFPDSRARSAPAAW